jgi:hypothetical protein
MWNCPVCGERLRKLWTAKIYHGVKFYSEGYSDLWYFLTITSHERNKTFTATWHVWPKAWAKLSTRMRRSFPLLRYVLIPEQHQSGRVPTHLLVVFPLKHRWVWEHGRGCGLG